MSSAPSYSNVLVAYSVYPFIVPGMFQFFLKQAYIYAIDSNGNYVFPVLFTKSSVNMPYGNPLTPLPYIITFTAAFYYPYFNFYLTMPYAYPMIVSFDYPVKFVTINMSAWVG